MTPAGEQAHAAEGREFIKRVMISEGVSMLVMLGMLWYLGPGRVLIAGVVHQARTRYKRRRNRIDSEVARFAAEVSRWDHEQAAQTDHTAGNGGCGCDGG